MAETPEPIANADIAAWLNRLTSELITERAGITGVESGTDDVTSKSFDGTVASTISPLHTQAGMREFTTFDLMEEDTYGIPSTKTLTSLLQQEMAKPTGGDMRVIAQYLIQLNTLESFRKSLTTKNSERINYIRGRQASASNYTKLVQVIRQALQNQPVGAGSRSPAQARGRNR